MFRDGGVASSLGGFFACREMEREAHSRCAEPVSFSLMGVCPAGKMGSTFKV